MNDNDPENRGYDKKFYHMPRTLTLVTIAWIVFLIWLMYRAGWFG